MVPGHVRLGAQNREGRPRSASCDASRERARYGCTLSFRVASVGQTHRALSPPKGRKASRRCKNASWKEAPHLSDKRVAASSRRTGARASDFPQRLPVARDHELRFVSLSDTTVGVLGSLLEDLHRSRGTRSYGSQVKHAGGSSNLSLRLTAQQGRRKPNGNGRQQAHRTARRPVRACLRVTTRTSEVDTRSVKAPRRPKSLEGGPHPRR